MIDPNIALSYRPTNLGFETPTQTMTGSQQLSNLQGIGQLQQSELTAQNQQNAAQALQMKTLAATNQAIQSNTKTNPDGTIAIDHQAVAQSLSQQGLGVAAQQYLDAQMKRDQQLTQLSTEKLDALDKQHEAVATGIGRVLGVSDPTQRAAAWQSEVKKAQAAKLDGADQLNPNQVPDDATLQSLLLTSKEGRQQIQMITAQKQAATQAAREQDYQKQVEAQGKRAEGYYDRMEATANQDNWKPANYTSGGRIVLYDQKGNIKLGPPADLQQGGSGPGSGSGVTGTQQDRDRQRNIADASAAEKDETKYDTLRSTLGNAIGSGDLYVDAKGNAIAWQKMIPRLKDEEDDDYQARIATAKAGFIDEMKSRYQQATMAANQATVRKNNAMQRNGANPQVSTEQAIAARNAGNGNNGQQPATTQQQQQQQQASPQQQQQAQPGKRWVYDPKKGLQPK